MNSLSFGRFALSVGAVAGLLAGCGPGSDVAASMATGAKSSGHLFVSNEIAQSGKGVDSVSVYGPASKKRLQLITQGLKGPGNLALDSSGNIYVVNPALNDVAVYASGNPSPVRTIRIGVDGPTGLAIDRSDNVYVGNRDAATVTVYAAGSNKLLRTITKGVGEANSLAFDSSGNLYVSNWDDVTVYAPGSSRLIRTISKGLSSTIALLLDESDNLYVANTIPSGGSEVVYARGKSSPKYTIADHNYPQAIALDPQGNFYVADALGTSGHGSVQVFDAANGTGRRSITSVLLPQALALDGSGNLYVADSYAKNVTVYAPGSSDVVLTITKGLSRPIQLLFGP